MLAPSAVHPVRECHCALFGRRGGPTHPPRVVPRRSAPPDRAAWPRSGRGTTTRPAGRRRRATLPRRGWNVTALRRIGQRGSPDVLCRCSSPRSGPDWPVPARTSKAACSMARVPRLRLSYAWVPACATLTPKSCAAPRRPNAPGPPSGRSAWSLRRSRKTSLAPRPNVPLRSGAIGVPNLAPPAPELASTPGGFSARPALTPSIPAEPNRDLPERDRARSPGMTFSCICSLRSTSAGAVRRRTRSTPAERWPQRRPGNGQHGQRRGHVDTRPATSAVASTKHEGASIAAAAHWRRAGCDSLSPSTALTRALAASGRLDHTRCTRLNRTTAAGSPARRLVRETRVDHAPRDVECRGKGSAGFRETRAGRGGREPGTFECESKGGPSTVDGCLWLSSVDP